MVDHLERFFALHVVALPIMLIMLVSYIVTAPRGVEQPRWH